MFLDDCFSEFFFTSSRSYLELFFEDEIRPLTVNETNYSETYLLNSRNFLGSPDNVRNYTTLYYTKNKGIIQITNNRDEVTIFTVVD